MISAHLSHWNRWGQHLTVPHTYPFQSVCCSYTGVGDVVMNLSFEKDSSFHSDLQLHLLLKLSHETVTLQLRNRGGRPAVGCARFNHHMGDGSCWSVRGEGTGPGKEDRAPHLQELLCRLHSALQPDQRGTNQSSPHGLQLPANLLRGNVVSERADGKGASFSFL